jgi:hypothetical protein
VVVVVVVVVEVVVIVVVVVGGVVDSIVVEVVSPEPSVVVETSAVVVTGASVVVTGASVVVTGASVVVTGASVVVTGASVVVVVVVVVVMEVVEVVVTGASVVVTGASVVVTGATVVVVPIEQSFPVRPSSQRQVYSLTPSTHSPALLQASTGQSSMFKSHALPVHPPSQTQLEMLPTAPDDWHIPWLHGSVGEIPAKKLLALTAKQSARSPHVSPTKPTVHAHEKPPTCSVQTPAFWQGLFGWQLKFSSTQFTPAYPGAH